MNLFGNAVPWRSIVKEGLERTAIVARFLCLLHVTNTYICTPILVQGPSMLPTLNLTGDVLLVECVSHRLGKVGPGDVVLVRSPVDPRKTLTKRVVAMGGDKVTFVVDPRNSDRVRTITVPRGHVWIQGDNIYSSHDSRRFGAVPYGLVEGKILCRVWPLDGFGLLDH